LLSILPSFIEADLPSVFILIFIYVRLTYALCPCLTCRLLHDLFSAPDFHSQPSLAHCSDCLWAPALIIAAFIILLMPAPRHYSSLTHHLEFDDSVIDVFGLPAHSPLVRRLHATAHLQMISADFALISLILPLLAMLLLLITISCHPRLILFYSPIRHHACPR